MKVTPHLRRFAIRIFVALLTFLIGAAITSVSFRNHHQPAESFRFLSGPPCREGLVSVESHPAAPLRITIADTDCQDSQSGNVQFLVENLSAKPISKYEIRGIQTYDELIDEGLGVSTENVEPLQPRQTQVGFMGGGVMKRSGGKPVSELRSFQLVVWSVDFADGTKWTRSSPK